MWSSADGTGNTAPPRIRYLETARLTSGPAPNRPTWAVSMDELVGGGENGDKGADPSRRVPGAWTRGLVPHMNRRGAGV